MIDDAAVETPGSCHLESWVTASRRGQALVTLSPGCTRLASPTLEIGGFVSHGWDRSSADTLVGLSPKLALRAEDRGVGIALSTSVGFDADRGRFDAASVVLPITIAIGDRLRFNLNAGWQWTRPGSSRDLFAGGQLEFAVDPNTGLMVEMFGGNRGKPGGQAGIRRTIGGGRADIDLLVGRYIDGITPTAVTVGFTLRR